VSAETTGGEDLNTGLLLFIPYRALEMRVYAALRTAGFDDATPAQMRVFQRVGPDGTRLTELAEAAEITKQTAGFLVDQLVDAGYVERVRDPADGRARLVRATAKGREATTVAAAEVARVEAEWEAHLGSRGMTALRRQLARLREITDPWA